MNKREQRVINAFINVVKSGEYSYSEAVTMIEDEKRYGYLTDAAKEVFHSQFESDEVIEETE